MQRPYLPLLKPTTQAALASQRVNPAHRPTLPFSLLLGGSAVAAYVVVAWLAFAHLLTGGWLVVSHDTTNTTTSGTGPGSASSASVLTASDGQPDAASVIPEGLDGSPMVLIITVQGAAESIEVTCPTTTARAPFDRLTVKPDQVMDAVHRWCSQTWLGP